LAESRIARAMSRDSFDPAVHYAAGVIYRASGRLTLAQDALWASIQYGGPPAPAYAQLGEISIQQKNCDEAAKLLRQALNYNPEDALTLADLAVAERLLGKIGAAAEAASAALAKMPLLPYALAEAHRVAESGGSPAWLQATFHDDWDKPFARDVQYYLEVSAWYLRLGDLDSASDVLHTALSRFPAASAPLKTRGAPVPVGPSPAEESGWSPLVDYYLAATVRRAGQIDRVKNFAVLASQTSPAKVFPNRLDDALVLAEVLLLNRADARAHYFLGNFLFAHGRYDDAAKAWLQALGDGFDDAVLERNLGVHAWRVQNDLKGAAAYYQKAIQLAPGDYRLYVDLDQIYEQLGDSPKRAELFAKAPNEVLERDTVRLRRALSLVEEKHFDEALEALGAHHFKPWEGGQAIREVFVRANIARGREALAHKEYAQAEQAFRQALEYPANLGVGKPDKPHEEEALYWLGEAFEAQHKADDARDAWQKAAATQESVNGVAAVLRAAALRRLGHEEESLKALTKLAGPDKQDATAYDFYVAGLAEELLGREDEAQNAFGQALALDPSLWQARVELHKP
jgi:tetratricopeptide (TPR) repeat protein